MRRLFLIAMLLAGAAQGETLFVDVNNPEGFATISDALLEASDGDVIFVAEGFYPETITIERNVSIISQGTYETTLINAQGTGVVVGAEVDSSAVLEGFTITAKGGHGVDMSSGGGLSIVRNKILNCSAYGVFGNRSLVLIRGNIFEGNTAAAFELRNDLGSVVTNNIIQGHPAGINTVYFNTQTPDTDPALFANNIVANNGGLGITVISSSPIIRNNTFYANANWAIWLQSTTAEVTANIIANNSSGINNRVGAVPIIAYNLQFDNTTEFGGGLASDVGEVTRDPKFTDARDSDFTLAEDSPAIDAGLPGAQHVDPDGSHNDIGAFGGPFAAFWATSYTGPVVTSIEVTPTRVQQGGTVTVRASGTTVTTSE
ncbi:MAG: hypothetical protein GKR89_12630 [Candidatus Latescibacteria bacterium]|nr:hypothetical protein [Candidatus Latescibacterota bacterium]